MRNIAIILGCSILLGYLPCKIALAEEPQEEVITIKGKSRATQDAGEKEKPAVNNEANPDGKNVPVAKDEAKNLKLLEAEEYKEAPKKKSSGADFLKNPALYILILFGLIIGGNA